MLKYTIYPYNTVNDKDLLVRKFGLRFHFNWKENDVETQTQDYGMRSYDPRIGRPPSIDPLSSEYPYYSPYQFFGNNPILYIDLDGAEPAKLKIKEGFYQEASDGVFAGGNMNENPVVMTKIKNQLAVGQIKPFVPNIAEKIKNKLNSPSANVVTGGVKLVAKIGFNAVNDVITYKNALVNGPNNAKDMTGEVKTGQSVIDAGVGAITNLVPMEKLATAAFGEMKVFNYSQFAYSLKGTKVSEYADRFAGMLLNNNKSIEAIKMPIQVNIVTKTTEGVTTTIKDGETK